MPTKRGKILIGTSGFGYDDWLGNFYPQFCPKPDYLRFYSSIFKTVEIDSTYYRMPKVEMVKRWYKQTSDDFIFTAKFPSRVTHEGTIAERLDNRKQFIEVISNLNEKLGVLLFQFPYGFKPDEQFETLERLITGLPGKIKFAVEMRNPKWLSNRLYDLLEAKKIALVQVDHPWMPKRSKATAKHSYIRLLGDRKKIVSDFSFVRDERIEDLRWWSEVVAELSRNKGEVYVYLNNHYTGHSPSAARKLMELLG